MLRMKKGARCNNNLMLRCKHGRIKRKKEKQVQEEKKSSLYRRLGLQTGAGDPRQGQDPYDSVDQ